MEPRGSSGGRPKSSHRVTLDRLNRCKSADSQTLKRRGRDSNPRSTERPTTVFRDRPECLASPLMERSQVPGGMSGGMKSGTSDHCRVVAFRWKEKPGQCQLTRPRLVQPRRDSSARPGAARSRAAAPGRPNLRLLRQGEARVVARLIGTLRGHPRASLRLASRSGGRRSATPPRYLRPRSRSLESATSRWTPNASGRSDRGCCTSPGSTGCRTATPR
jgi:hypothetical protein